MKLRFMVVLSLFSLFMSHHSAQLRAKDDVIETNRTADPDIVKIIDTLQLTSTYALEALFKRAKDPVEMGKVLSLIAANSSLADLLRYRKDKDFLVCRWFVYQL